MSDTLTQTKNIIIVINICCDISSVITFFAQQLGGEEDMVMMVGCTREKGENYHLTNDPLLSRCLAWDYPGLRQIGSDMKILKYL